MAKNFKSLNVEESLFPLIDDAKEEYLRHHPEMKDVFITKSKIVKEALEFYIKN